MFSGRYPTRRRVSSECSATSRPPIIARPEVGGKNPVRIRIIVVLPEPLGPSNPMISPFSTLKETWLTARVAPKYLVRSWTSIMKPAFALSVLRGEIPRSHGHERGCLHGSQFIAIALDRKDAIQRAF